MHSGTFEDILEELHEWLLIHTLPSLADDIIHIAKVYRNQDRGLESITLSERAKLQITMG